MPPAEDIYREWASGTVYQVESEGNYMMIAKQLLKAPSLDTQFPVLFPNGRQIYSLIFWCLSCRKVTTLAKVHGHVSRIVPGVADVTAVYCCLCGETTTYRIRLREDGSYSYLENGRWQDKIFSGRSVNMIARILKNRLTSVKVYWKVFWARRRLKKLISVLMAQLDN